MTSFDDVKKARLLLKCKRHDKKTRDYKKLKEQNTRKRQTNVHVTSCMYSIIIAQKKFQNSKWMLITFIYDHNHEMIENSFVFIAHANRNSNREQTLSVVETLKHSHIFFNQIEFTLNSLRLSIDRNEYYNLQKNDVMISKNRLRYALNDLKKTNFHVRCQKFWIYENNVRVKRVVNHFFFANAWQIFMIKRFINRFVLQTNVTFNTNELNLFLSILIEKINIFISFVIAYCYVIFEFKIAFIFVWKCINDLFFYKKCFESKIMFDDFALKFFSSLCKQRNINMIEKNMQIKNEMMQTRFDDVNIEIYFQLCAWHAMKIIQKRVTRKEYSIEKKKYISRVEIESKQKILTIYLFDVTLFCKNCTKLIELILFFIINVKSRLLLYALAKNIRILIAYLFSRSRIRIQKRNSTSIDILLSIYRLRNWSRTSIVNNSNIATRWTNNNQIFRF